MRHEAMEALIQANEILARSKGLYKKNPYDSSKNYEIDMNSMLNDIGMNKIDEDHKDDVKKSIATKSGIFCIENEREFENQAYSDIGSAEEESNLVFGSSGSIFGRHQNIDLLPEGTRPICSISGYIRILSVCYVDDTDEVYISNHSYLQYRCKFDVDSIIDELTCNLIPLYRSMNIDIYKGIYHILYTDPITSKLTSTRCKRKKFLNTSVIANETINGLPAVEFTTAEIYEAYRYELSLVMKTLFSVLFEFHKLEDITICSKIDEFIDWLDDNDLRFIIDDIKNYAH